jgi:hypothetical protein
MYGERGGLDILIATVDVGKYNSILVTFERKTERKTYTDKKISYKERKRY